MATRSSRDITTNIPNMFVDCGASKAPPRIIKKFFELLSLLPSSWPSFHRG